MWAVATGIAVLTEDTILIPTVILLGSFLVPISVVAFAFSRAEATRLGIDVLALAFILAGASANAIAFPSGSGIFA